MVAQDMSRGARVDEAIDRLTDEFKGVLPSQVVREQVTSSLDSYRGARIVDFVPLLVYRSARQRLGTMARANSFPRAAD